MTKYFIRIEMPEGRVKEIMDKLDAAQETILECYHQLEDLGIVWVKEKPPEADG